MTSLIAALRRKVEDTRPTALRGLNVDTRIDARGFEQVMLTDVARRQISISSAVADEVLLDEATVNRWNARVAETERMLVTFAADSTNPDARPLLGAVFRAAGKAERKDLTELATWLTINGPRIYDTASDVGLDATPVNEADLTDRSATILAAGGEHRLQTLDDITQLAWQETNHHVEVDSTSFSVFTVSTSVPGVAEDLDGLIATWDLPAQVTRTRWMRPYAHPELLEELDLSDPGRMWATVTVTGGEGSDKAFLQALHPATRLHTRRGYCRQSLLLAASLALGPTGFQNLMINKDLLR
ncbi:hypothetical protein ACT3SZ_15275 [Corynebacterium sp. AOP40-9SA-29]|uniref:hypothetical protein n=1 Tax=Corynebacterium sp. AOP40-9SA-29 TaxID=3457677 RepID=UPI0040334ECB